MSWEIRVPHRDREQKLDGYAVSELPRALEDLEERTVTRNLMLEGLLNGVGTIGGLLDEIASDTPTERRHRLDRARAAAGLEATATIDARRDNEARSAGLAHLPWRDEDGRTFAFCAHRDCLNFPVNHVGMHEPTRAKRWWCEEHRHLAAEGDMDDWSFGVRYSGSGALEWASEVQTERERALRDEERARARTARRLAERQPEAEEHQRSEEAWTKLYKPANIDWEPGP